MFSSMVRRPRVLNAGGFAAGAAITAGVTPVTPDALGDGEVTLTATNYTYTGLTIGTGNALVVGVWIQVTGTTTSLTWNGVSLTQIGSDINDPAGGIIRFYGLLNPVSGNKNLIITVSANTHLAMAAMSFNGVNSTFGTAFSNFNSNTDATGTHNTISVNITTASGHYVFGMANGYTATSMTISGTQLAQTNSFDLQAWNYTAFSGTPYALNATYNVNDTMAIGGFDISP